MNCYEHIFIFHKHRNDNTPYPCPVCGCLKVNGNAYSEIGLKSWECKNLECFERSKSNRGKRFSLKTNTLWLSKTLYASLIIARISVKYKSKLSHWEYSLAL